MRLLRPGLFAVLLAVTTLPAQRRQPLLGEVVDGDGKPVAGAEVTLIADDASLVGLHPIDLCTAHSDARGRFVASALVGVRYLALASTPERDGVAAIARPVAGLSCGQLAVLRLELQGRRRRIDIPLAGEWSAVAGLHVRMSFQHAAGHHVVLPIGKDGIELPPLALLAQFSLHDDDGAFLGTIGVPPPGDDQALMPSPMPLAVRVVDDAGAPVAAARVTVHDGSYGAARTGRTATTDAQGRCSLLWGGWRDPFDSAPNSFFVTATAPGFAEGASGWTCLEPFVGYQIVTQHSQPELLVPLARQTTPPRGGVDPKFAGKRARLEVLGLVQLQPGAHYFLPRSYDVVIASDGSYELPQLPHAASTVSLQLPPLDGRRVELLPARAPTLPAATAAECDVVVGQVIDQGGGPATSAKVLLACHAVDTTLQWLVPDAAGRFERTLQRGRWTLLAIDDTGWANHELDGEVRGPIELRLLPKPQRRVRVEDRDGRPVAGAAFEPGEFRFGIHRPAGLESVLDQLGWNTFAEHMRRPRTDARGEATLHFLPWPGVTPTAFAFVGDHRQRSDDTAVETADDVLVFRLR
jgi:hypothetical protein